MPISRDPVDSLASRGEDLREDRQTVCRAWFHRCPEILKFPHRTGCPRQTRKSLSRLQGRPCPLICFCGFRAETRSGSLELDPGSVAPSSSSLSNPYFEAARCRACAVADRHSHFLHYPIGKARVPDADRFMVPTWIIEMPIL